MYFKEKTEDMSGTASKPVAECATVGVTMQLSVPDRVNETVLNFKALYQLSKKTHVTATSCNIDGATRADNIGLWFGSRPQNLVHLHASGRDLICGKDEYILSKHKRSSEPPTWHHIGELGKQFVVAIPRVCINDLNSYLPSPSSLGYMSPLIGRLGRLLNKDRAPRNNVINTSSIPICNGKELIQNLQRFFKKCSLPNYSQLTRDSVIMLYKEGSFPFANAERNRAFIRISGIVSGRIGFSIDTENWNLTENTVRPISLVDFLDLVNSSEIELLEDTYLKDFHFYCLIDDVDVLYNLCMDIRGLGYKSKVERASSSAKIPFYRVELPLEVALLLVSLGFLTSIVYDDKYQPTGIPVIPSFLLTRSPVEFCFTFLNTFLSSRMKYDVTDRVLFNTIIFKNNLRLRSSLECLLTRSGLKYRMRVERDLLFLIIDTDIINMCWLFDKIGVMNVMKDNAFEKEGIVIPKEEHAVTLPEIALAMRGIVGYPLGLLSNSAVTQTGSTSSNLSVKRLYDVLRSNLKFDSPGEEFISLLQSSVTVTKSAEISIGAITTFQYIYEKVCLLTPLPFELNPKRSKLPQFSRKLLTAIKHVEASKNTTYAVPEDRILAGKDDVTPLERERYSYLSCGEHTHLRDWLRERNKAELCKYITNIPADIEWDDDFIYLPVTSIAPLGKRCICLVKTSSTHKGAVGVIINGFVVRASKE